MGRMARVALLGLSIALPGMAGAQSAPAGAQTKLEAFSARTGFVVIKGYTVVGGMSGKGSLWVEVREFKDAANPRVSEYGIAVEVEAPDRLGLKRTVYVDEDELDGLVRGIEYLGKLDKTATSMRNFEAIFRTRGDLGVGVYGSALGEPGFAVTTARIGGSIAGFKLTEIATFHKLITDARAQIAAAKAVAR